MFARKNKDKKHSLYYLLPGMTRANREKRRRFFWYSVMVGMVFSVVIGLVIWLANRGVQPP